MKGNKINFLHQARSGHRLDGNRPSICRGERKKKKVKKMKNEEAERKVRMAGKINSESEAKRKKCSRKKIKKATWKKDEE